MGGLNARRVEPWFLVDFDPVDIYQTVEKTVYDNDGTPIMVEQTDEKGKPIKDDDGNAVKVEKRIKVIQVRSQYTLTIARSVFGITSFGEMVGETKQSWALLTGPGTSINYTSTAKKWVCTKDRPELIDLTIGEYRQTQVWVYMSKWKNVEDDKFE
jgi:hypothetical protein